MYYYDFNDNSLLGKLERKFGKFGFKYLQAIREALTERNNLPDYRTPQDQGFTDYNKSWVTPDFKEFCENNLKK